jgi:outer membrane protein assembly factor BamB
VSFNLMKRAVLSVCLLLLSAHTVAAQDWPQWGGPARDFKSSAKGLAASWPEGGPRKVWSRELGEGYSSVAVAGSRLYTMLRRGEQEVVVALDAATGQTLWEYAYDAPFSREYSMENGPGPHSTPTVAGGRVFTTGATGKLHALDAARGKLLWAHDLMGEFKGTLRVNGYACSPVVYGDHVIVQVGGAGAAVVAFAQKDGAVVWKKHDFKNSSASPLVIRVDGQDQLVAFMYDTIVGLDPRGGDLLWSYPHQTEFGLNVSTPVWGDDGLLFLSSSYGGGSRVLRLKSAGGRATVEEVWAHKLMRIHFGNVVRLGDTVYGSSGDFGTAPLTAVDVKTGKVLWRERGFARATFVAADGRLILLDEDGHLALATPTPEGLKLHSKVALLTGNAWTAPALAGTRLYVRDRRNVMALELK